MHFDETDFFYNFFTSVHFAYVLHIKFVDFKQKIVLQISYNTIRRAEAKHVWKENTTKNIWPNTRGRTLSSRMEQRTLHFVQWAKHRVGP